MIPDCCGRGAPAGSLGRIPARKSLQASNEKRPASAEEEGEGPRDSTAAEITVRFSWLPAASSYLFLSSCDRPFLFSFYHPGPTWNLINQEAEGTEVSPCDIRKRRVRARAEDSGPVSLGRVSDNEFPSCVLPPAHPWTFCRWYRLYGTESTCLSSVMYPHTMSASLSLLLPISFLACASPRLYPRTQDRFALEFFFVLYFLGVLVSPLCRVSTFTSIKPSEKYTRPPSARFQLTPADF